VLKVPLNPKQANEQNIGVCLFVLAGSVITQKQLQTAIKDKYKASYRQQGRSQR